jgi:hypothetical protein
VKFYLYISDAKVDMLFPQVPHDIKKKVATEWKMDLKLLSASRRVDTEDEDNRIARLETVVDFIKESGNVGTIDEPDEYIADTLTMCWGIFKIEPSKSPVYFTGETEKTVVGLGGSHQHLLGRPGQSEPVISPIMSNSLTPALLDCLFKELGWGEDNFRVLGANEERTDEVFLQAVEASAQDIKGPRQRVEFLAKRLLYGPVVRREFNRGTGIIVESALNALLGTPLYVAMAD